MLKVEQLDLTVVQAAIFTSDISLFSAPKILTVILNKYIQRYDGEVEALPLPSEIPPEVPRIIFQSKDEVHRLEVAQSRIDCYWTNPDYTQPDVTQICNLFNETLKFYIESLGIRVNKLGLSLSYTYKTENPAQLIINEFCNQRLKDKILHSTEEFELNNYETKKVNNWQFSLWAKFKTVIVTDNNIDHPALLVEQEITTSSSEKIDNPIFNFTQIDDFFFIALKQLEKNLNLYFGD